MGVFFLKKKKLWVVLNTSIGDRVDFFLHGATLGPNCSDNMFCFLLFILTRLYDANKYKNV